MIAKSDQQPVIKAIAHDVGQEKTHGRRLVEACPLGSSQSNGIVEREIQSARGQTRIIEIAVEDRLGLTIPTMHPVAPWILENAGHLLSRCVVGKDGKTAYERNEGKAARVYGLEFRTCPVAQEARGRKCCQVVEPLE